MDPPAHLGMVLGLTRWEPGTDHLIDANRIHDAMSEVGIYSIWGNSALADRRRLRDYEVAVHVRRGMSPSLVQLDVRTSFRTWTATFQSGAAVAYDWLRTTLRLIDRLLEERYPDAVMVAVSSGIERLVASALLALEDENSQLRAALEQARIEIGFLRGQLLAVNEAQATGRKPIIKAVLGGVGAILLAATTGLTEGVPGAVADRTSPSELVAECVRIQDLLDESDQAKTPN